MPNSHHPTACRVVSANPAGFQVSDCGRADAHANSYLDLFSAAADESPLALCVADENSCWSYREVDARSNHLARRLRELGAGAATHVLVYLDRSAETLVSLLAVNKTRAAYVPVEPGAPAERLRHILREVRPTVAVTTSRLEEHLGVDSETVLLLDAVSSEVETISTEDRSDTPAPQDTAYVIYTSGTCGQPKGVVVEHGQLLSYVQRVMARLELPHGGSFASLYGFSTDLGNTMVFPAICTGGVVHLPGRATILDSERLSRFLVERKIDCVKYVPSHFEALAEGAAIGALLPRQRLVFGGERLRWETVTAPLAERPPGCRVFNHYGPTETTVGVSTFEITSAEKQPTPSVPIGLPLPGTTFFVLGRGLAPAGPGEVGELMIGGRGVAREYLRRPAETSQAFLPASSLWPERVFRTGDLVRRVSGGAFEFIRRVDDQVKVAGHRVDLSEIRSAVNRLPGVQDSLVLLRRGRRGSEFLVAYYISRAPLENTIIRGFLGKTLPKEVIPTYFVHLERMPLGLGGKPDPSALPGFGEIPPNTLLSHHSSSATEGVVLGCCLALMGGREPDPDAGFFECGGTSMMAIRLIAAIQDAVGFRISLDLLFESSSLRDLAARIDALPGACGGREFGWDLQKPRPSSLGVVERPRQRDPRRDGRKVDL